MNDYEGIVELQLVSTRRANRYLEGGYRLLSIESVSGSGRHPVGSSGSNAGAYFVRRMVRYVVGRTADVAAMSWDLPEETPPAS